jgi:hypothetical protein
VTQELLRLRLGLLELELLLGLRLQEQ